MLRALLIILLAATASCASTRTPQSTLETDEAEFIDSLFVAFTGAVPGATVMIARDEHLLFCKGYGLANLGTRRPADCNTAYRVGSVSKQFTAMAILKLIDQGVLDLSDSIVDLLPGFLEHRRDITLHQLLTHRSGLPGYDPLTVDAEDMSISDADVVHYLQSVNTAYFLPGQDFGYSNAAYAVLAEIVAAHSNMSFPEFMEKELFAPARMTSTTLEANRVSTNVRALGYSPENGDFLLKDQSPASAIKGDGSIYTTANDYFQWHLALTNERLVSPTLHQEAYRPQEGTNGRYGLGWFMPRRPPLNFVQHGGATAGFLSYTARIPESGITVAIFTNRGWPEDGNPVDLSVRAEALLSIASDGAHPMPPADAF